MPKVNTLNIACLLQTDYVNHVLVESVWYNNNNTHLMASFQPVPERTILDFNACTARDDGVAVASAGPYANHLHFVLDR